MCGVRMCLFDQLLQWRTWRKKCAPADATGGVLCITHKCWRARWRQWEASWWARWTTCRSWGTSCGARSRKQRSAKLQWRNWLQEWGKPPVPLPLRFQSRVTKLQKNEMATSFQQSCERFLDGTNTLVKERDLRYCYDLSLQWDIMTGATVPLHSKA